MGDDKGKKVRTVMTGGIVSIVTGVTAWVALSWFGHQIVTDLYNSLTPMSVKYKLGPAIYIDWAGSTIYHAPRFYPKA